ncbi:ABC transporter substrate-binding protein [Bacillus sp. 2205SS5-2]|uniref:ABC transporter substrate-binding protein n=1 Tax=Bacillus sp. 2205SS5-2 TaxID=3109031 RepID=UPI0030067DFF
MKRIYMISLFLILSLGLSGCGDAETKPKETTSETKLVTTTFPVTLTDSAGQEVTIEERPTKIVSLIPSNTEILFELGLSEEVIAVTDFDNYPEEVFELEKIGGMEFNVEKIISLNPDLVLAHESSYSMAQAGLKQIQDAGVAVVVVDQADSFEDLYASVKLIGQATGQVEEANQEVEEMKSALLTIKEKADSISEDKKKTVFFEISPAPEIYTAGQNTFLHEILELISAKNAVGEQEGWPQMTEEAIVALNPDVIITTYGYYSEDPIGQVLAREGWIGVTAVEKEEIFDIHSDLVTRPGPRLIQGVEGVAKAVYPEVFTN